MVLRSRIRIEKTVDSATEQAVAVDGEARSQLPWGEHGKPQGLQKAPSAGFVKERNGNGIRGIKWAQRRFQS